MRPVVNLGTCMLQEQTPNARDAQKRSEILQAIDEIVQTGLPDYPGLCIKPYGSYVSGLYCPSGDLDLSVEGIPTGGYVRMLGSGHNRCPSHVPMRGCVKLGSARKAPFIAKQAPCALTYLQQRV